MLQTVHIYDAKAAQEDKTVHVVVLKEEKTLILYDENHEVLRAVAAFGRICGPKRREGDGKTPEGLYQFCLAKEQGKYGLSLGINYPNAQDALLAYQEKAIDLPTLRAVESAVAEGRRPPWSTVLGGEIYIHEGPTDTNWTRGCIALAPEAMATLYACRNRIEDVEIRP
jgi:murein L,D-transpeptidase YafK